jgi:hypothetical protein
MKDMQLYCKNIVQLKLPSNQSHCKVIYLKQYFLGTLITNIFQKYIITFSERNTPGDYQIL